MSEEKKPEKFNKYLEQVTNIQDAAANTKSANCVSLELGYQQALSILLRHRQLVREGKLHPGQLNNDKKAEQINKCYEQRNSLKE